jgi:hypothetical protein
MLAFSCRQRTEAAAAILQYFGEVLISKWRQSFTFVDAKTKRE